MQRNHGDSGTLCELCARPSKENDAGPWLARFVKAFTSECHTRTTFFAVCEHDYNDQSGFGLRTFYVRNVFVPAFELVQIGG